MKKYFYVIAVLALGLAACNKNEVLNPGEGSAASGAPVYYFSISASLGEGAGTKAVTIDESATTSSFANTDKVYLFVQRGETVAIAHNGTDAATYLTPSNISGASCTLEGALKFYYNDNGSFAAFEPAADDVVYLFYKMNDVQNYASSIKQSSYKFFSQNGSQDQDVYWGQTYLASRGASAHDFAEAKMKVTAVAGDPTDGYTLTMVQYEDESKGSVHFERISALFRQRLSFTNSNGDPIDIPTLESLTVSFEGGSFFVGYYWPFNPGGTYAEMKNLTIADPIVSAEGDVYLSLMFCDDNKDQPLVLEAKDTDGNIYSVTKNAPTGGFRNGKYYYGSATLAWQKCIKPMVTGTSATLTNGTYTIPENPVDLTISGYSEGYEFDISDGHGGTITLDNLTATSTGAFLEQKYNESRGDISLVLTGTNSITFADFRGINVYGNLKLSCTGSSATLTLTTTLSNAWNCGISGYNYRSDGEAGVSSNEWNTTTALDVSSMLAADGFTVIRSARTDGPDINDDSAPDSYTWTYTVTSVDP